MAHYLGYISRGRLLSVRKDDGYGYVEVMPTLSQGQVDAIVEALEARMTEAGVPSRTSVVYVCSLSELPPPKRGVPVKGG
jgi:hypothetical protein